MTKAKARARKKARLAAGGGKTAAKSPKPEVKIRAGQFNPEADAKGYKGRGVVVKNLAAMKRGSARSR